MKWRDRWVYVYILIEFQHKVDKAMPVRVMSYISLLYLNLLNNKKLDYGKRKNYDKPEYEKVRNLEEVIRMVKTFRDFDREKDKKEFTEKGKLKILADLVKDKILSLQQAATKMGMTVAGFKKAIKSLALE